MKQYDKVEAIFRPKRTDDLVEGAAEWIGRKLDWSAYFKIEEGEYVGDWAMVAISMVFRPPFAWVPERDLEIIKTDGAAE